MHAHHLLARHREHAEGVVFAQVLLGRERKPRQVGQRFAVRRVHAGGIERAPVVRHLVVGGLQRLLQPLQLQRLQLVAAGAFDRLQLAGLRLFDGHGFLQADQSASAGRPFAA